MFECYRQSRFVRILADVVNGVIQVCVRGHDARVEARLQTRMFYVVFYPHLFVEIGFDGIQYIRYGVWIVSHRGPGHTRWEVVMGSCSLPLPIAGLCARDEPVKRRRVHD